MKECCCVFVPGGQEERVNMEEKEGNLKGERQRGIRFSSSKGSKAKAKESRGKWKGREVSLSSCSDGFFRERKLRIAKMESFLRYAQTHNPSLLCFFTFDACAPTRASLASAQHALLNVVTCHKLRLHVLSHIPTNQVYSIVPFLNSSSGLIFSFLWKN